MRIVLITMKKKMMQKNRPNIIVRKTLKVFDEQLRQKGREWQKSANDSTRMDEFFS